jgi:hypothetical protein
VQAVVVVQVLQDLHTQQQLPVQAVLVVAVLVLIPMLTQGMELLILVQVVVQVDTTAQQQLMESLVMAALV